ESEIVILSHENLLTASQGNILHLERPKFKGFVTIRHCSILSLPHVEYFSIVKSTQL
ncbi:unnamed protein product, partial [Rotaria sp. Silwood2]